MKISETDWDHGTALSNFRCTVVSMPGVFDVVMCSFRLSPIPQRTRSGNTENYQVEDTEGIDLCQRDAFHSLQVALIDMKPLGTRGFSCQEMWTELASRPAFEAGM